jgi:hypothetical protein
VRRQASQFGGVSGRRAGPMCRGRETVPVERRQSAFAGVPRQGHLFPRRGDTRIRPDKKQQQQNHKTDKGSAARNFKKDKRGNSGNPGELFVGMRPSPGFQMSGPDERRKCR